jgi:hypothetical protein
MPVTLAEAVLLVLRSLAPYSQEPEPETAAELDWRRTQAAICITGAAETRARGWSRERVAASLVALGEAESNFARYVWAGECDRGPIGAQCDPRHGKAQSIGYWQQRPAACGRAWRLPHGSTAQVCASAACAASLLQGAAHRCRNRASSPEAGAFAGYRSIDCSWRGGIKRARRMIYLESRIRSEMLPGLAANDVPDLGWTQSETSSDPCVTPPISMRVENLANLQTVHPCVGVQNSLQFFDCPPAA